MDTSSHTKIWKEGRLQEADKDDAAMTALCQAVERAVRAHQGAGVRAVILMVEPGPAQPSAPQPTRTAVPVYVDVFDSGFNTDSGYGHGI